MASAHVVPPLISVLVGLVISMIAWGFLLARRQIADDAAISTRDNLLLGLMLLAAFILGAFVTYLLLNIGL